MDILIILFQSETPKSQVTATLILLGLIHLLIVGIVSVIYWFKLNSLKYPNDGSILNLINKAKRLFYLFCFITWGTLIVTSIIFILIDKMIKSYLDYTIIILLLIFGAAAILIVIILRIITKMIHSTDLTFK